LEIRLTVRRKAGWYNATGIVIADPYRRPFPHRQWEAEEAIPFPILWFKSKGTKFFLTQRLERKELGAKSRPKTTASDI